MSGPAIDTSHIKSPSDPMTSKEREAVRQELRETSEAIARTEADHGSMRDELSQLHGNPMGFEGSRRVSRHPPATAQAEPADAKEALARSREDQDAIDRVIDVFNAFHAEQGLLSDEFSSN